MKINILHVLWYDDVKFYRSLVECFYYKIIPYTTLKIVFITPYQNVYQDLKDFNNVYLVKEQEIIKYFYESDWIFLHPKSIGRLKTIMIPTKIANKIIWRTWGHDIRPLDNKKIANKIINKLYLKKILEFKAIAIDGPVDQENVENCFGKAIPLVQLHYYCDNDKYFTLKRIKENTNRSDNSKIRIMIGHNSAEADNHFELIDALSKFRNNNVIYSFPLSYGDRSRARRVKEYAIKKLGIEKVEFIDEYMTFEQYAEYINSVDVACMDQLFSNALGNLQLLIYFDKKIIIHRNSDFDRTFKEDRIVLQYSDQINNMTFEELICNNEITSKQLHKYIENSPLTELNFALNEWVNYINLLYNSNIIQINDNNILK